MLFILNKSTFSQGAFCYSYIVCQKISKGEIAITARLRYGMNQKILLIQNPKSKIATQLRYFWLLPQHEFQFRTVTSPITNLVFVAS